MLWAETRNLSATLQQSTDILSLVAAVSMKRTRSEETPWVLGESCGGRRSASSGDDGPIRPCQQG